MVNNADIRPGVWLARNLVKHQGDYWIYRVSKIENSKTKGKRVFFNPTITLSHSNFGGYGWGKVNTVGFDLPWHSVREKFRLVRKLIPEIKYATVRACFNVRD